MKVNILHKDKDIIVAIKPSGVPAQSDRSVSEDMVSYLKNYVYETENIAEEPYMAVINRLDRPVSGIMLFARSKEAAASLTKQITDGEINKYYQAVLTGELPDWSGTLTDYIYHDPKTNVSKVVSKDTEGAKEAILDYEVLDVLESDEGLLSYVLINLITGRHHQIRVQMANKHAGIWGDTKYNPKFAKTKKNYKQIGLCATRIEFTHPITGEEMIFKYEPEGEAFEVIEMEDF